jgi:hypothetical protein
MLDSCDRHLLDIASNIQIESNFCIYHPNYQPFALPNQLAERFQKNPAPLQQKYLTLLLRNFIYGIYYNGALQRILALNAVREACRMTSPASFLPHESIANNSVLGIDKQLYQKLHNSNYGIGYFDQNWQVLRREPDGSLAVTKGGLTMHVENVAFSPGNQLRHLQSAQPGDKIDIWMPKNRLRNGCYVAVGNVGHKLQANLDADLGKGRIYLNLTAAGAIALMESLTVELNAAAIPFSFQVPYNYSAYGRYDSGVLYFERNDYPLVREVLQSIYTQHKSHFRQEIPLFTKFLAPGVSFAEEPERKFVAQENFGMNRCQIVANALLEAWQKGKNSPRERMEMICKHFADFGIDWRRPYLNPCSEDIYYPLT